ncbi:MAG: helix-turn-helix domain-containing protein [Erysipelotrichaceae bacterium]|nr:helix-turn-helix domain-containing protein [Erysipelotrichaceae bacterium]
MFHKAIDLRFNEGTSLEVTFQDGQVKQYDMSVLFEKYPELKALKDRNLFVSGKLQGYYGIVWNDFIDIETETIYQNGHTVEIHEKQAVVKAGEAVEAARKKKKVSQFELSQRTGIHQAEISKLERGISNPSVKTLERIAEALDCKLEIVIE